LPFEHWIHRPEDRANQTSELQESVISAMNALVKMEPLGLIQNGSNADSVIRAGKVAAL
jgi:hypothetical protein